METRQEFLPTRLTSRQVRLRIKKGVSTMTSVQLKLSCTFQITTPYLQGMNTSKKLLLGSRIVLFSRAELPTLKSNWLAIL